VYGYGHNSLIQRRRSCVEGPAGSPATVRNLGDFRRWRGSDQASRDTGALPSRASQQAFGPGRYYLGRSQRPDDRALVPEPDQNDTDVDTCEPDRRIRMVMAHRSHALYARGFYAG